MLKNNAMDTIVSNVVTLIDENGVNKGTQETTAAQEYAESLGLDLVVVSNGDIPVCKVIDYNKFCYEKKKKEKEAAKKAKINNMQTKEIRFGPNTAKHDIEIKLKKATQFIKDGNRVCLNIEYNGREIQFISNGYELMNSILDSLGCLIDFSIDKEIKQNGKKISVTLKGK